MTEGLQGIAAAPGLARGHSLRWEGHSSKVPEYTPADPRLEKVRLLEARQVAAEQLRELVERISGQGHAAEAALFEAHAMFLDDPALLGKAEGMIDAGLNAGQAWSRACESFAVQLESLPDETLRARSADVRDVAWRVIDILVGAQKPLDLSRPAVLIARDLSPSQTALLDTSKVLAFCTAEGGPTSHTSILAKALGIPAVVGLGETVLSLPDDTLLLVDGASGLVLRDPSPEQDADFLQRMQLERERHSLAAVVADEPAVTRDGRRIEVVANVGSVDDARTALEHGAEGIGLLRTEFLFLGRDRPPDEETQFAAYRAILELMGPRPVVVRTLDIGGDKEVPFFDFGPEANPFLGYRAIRISLDHPDQFRVQLRALLRAGAGHDLRIMFPMIASLDEVRGAKSHVDAVQAELRSRDIPIAEKLQIGIMVEIPSVVLLAEKFASEVDFFSIGTNDLTQYTFAAERGSKRLSHLNDPCHPAVLREIEMTVAAAHRAGKWVGVCGEMAGDLQAVPLLLGLGVDELSMAPRQIPLAKQVVRDWSLEAAQELTRHALAMDNAKAVREAVTQFSK